VKKLWKANFALILQALEFFPAPERLVLPLWTCADLSDLLNQAPLLSSCVGFSRTVRVGASEKCAKGFNEVHMPCTTFPQAPELCKSKEIANFTRENHCLRAAENIIALF
jgi:hypothetical protein